jgi:hypothetical protein
MKQIKVKAAAVLAARSEDAYATIADYREGHPNIMPKENWYNFQLEQGGYGEGTVYHITSCVLGVEKSYHHRVSEPEPGRILVEHEIGSIPEETNRFTVRPLEQGEKCHVEIAVTMNPSPGLKGLVERVVVPLVIPALLCKELKLLEAVAKKRETLVLGSKPSSNT